MSRISCWARGVSLASLRLTESCELVDGGRGRPGRGLDGVDASGLSVMLLLPLAMSVELRIFFPDVNGRRNDGIALWLDDEAMGGVAEAGGGADAVGGACAGERTSAVSDGLPGAVSAVTVSASGETSNVSIA